MPTTAPQQLLDPTLVLAEGGLKAGETAADFGCGTVGHFIFPAAVLVGKDGLVYAIDIQKSVLASVQSRAQLMHCGNVRVLWGDIERPNGVRVPNEQFDLSLVINNLSLAHQPAVLAEEVRRATKVDGRLVLVDWQTTQTPMGPPLERRLAQERAQEIFEQQGFGFDHSFVPGPFHWGLVFIRRS